MKLIFIKNQELEIPVDEGAIITENYNETLDSANIRISHLDYKLDIEPFDQVKLIDLRWDSPRYFCVDDYSMIQESLDETTYSYNINLFSETKLLEGIILPNLSITPLRTSGGRKVWDYLEMYLDNYGQQVREVRSSGYLPTFVSKWHFADRVSDRFRQIVCPELQWNQPTLREVLNDLMMIDDCIVVMHNNEIDYIDLTEKKSDIETKRFETQGIKLVQTTIKLSSGGTGSGRIEYSEKYIKNVSGFCETGTLTIRNYSDGVIRFSVTGGTSGENAVRISYNYSTHETINYIQESQSSNNYASEIRMSLQNVFQQNQEGINNIVTTSENLMFTTEGNVLTDSNYFLKTKYPILRVNHLWICFYAYVVESSDDDPEKNIVYFKVDLCNLRSSADDEGKYFNFVKEDKEWQILDPLFNLAQVGNFALSGFRNSGGEIEKIEKAYNKQTLSLRYTRGSNIIDGFSGAKKVLLFQTNQKSILNCLLSLAFNKAREEWDSINRSLFPHLREYLSCDPKLIVTNTNAYAVPTFKIEYETTANCVFSASKEDYPQNDRTIVDNQTNSWVDAYSQGNLEKQKANRIGNVNFMINQRTNNFDKAIKIGDFWDDNIVYQVQYEYYSEYIGVNANATKNYILRDYFTGIDSKIRTWVNARDEAFEKHELYKYYVEASNINRGELNFNNELETKYDSISSGGIAQYFAKPIVYLENEKESGYKDPNPITHGYYRKLRDRGDKIKLESISRFLGKSIVFTTGFDDNWILYKKIILGTGDGKIPRLSVVAPIQFGDTFLPPRILDTIVISPTFAYGGIPLLPKTYVDEDGENYYGEDYGTFIGFTTQTEELESSHKFTDLSSPRDEYIKALEKPEFLSADLESVFQINSYHLKDNKEICKYSLQFDFCSENKDIILTDEFVRMQDLIRTFKIQNADFDYKQADNKYSKNLGILTVSSVTSQNIGSRSCSITINSSDLISGNYIYIYYNDKLVLITKYPTFYLNVLKLRNKNKYVKNSDGEWIKTGEI